MFSAPIPAELSFIGAYGVDVFISYGHIDNQASWVSNFHSALLTRLQELLGTAQVVIWRDVKLNGLDAFEDVIRQKVSNSALFISVLSPRYLGSPSCRNELDWFVAGPRAANGLRFEVQSRLIRVVKTRLPDGTAQPSNFNATLGYEFYESDPQNPEIFREFGSQEGMPRFDKFADRIDLLAQTIARVLLKMRQAQPAKKAECKTVFLARTASDLETRRASIQNELSGRGHEVIPIEPFPETASELTVFANELLTKANISVHLLGRKYGVIPEEETRSYGEVLYDLALVQRVRAGFHQLVWIPEDLQSPESAQQALLAKVRGAVSEGGSGESDVFETSFESFKEGLLDILSRKPEPKSVKAKAVYLLCDQPDLRQEPLEKIQAYLRGRGHPVELPPFQGEPEELRAMEEELIGDTDAALIYYGTARDLWVLRKRKNVLKVLSIKQRSKDYARALYLATPKDDVKAANYLTMADGVYPEIEGFPPLLLLGDCEAFQPSKLDRFINLIEERE